MFKKVGIIFFLAYYLVFMILPNLPFVQYYYGQHKLSKNVQIITNNDSRVLVGDICFLKALIKSTNEHEESKKDEAPPESNKGSSTLIYLIAELTNLNKLNPSQDIKFQNTIELLTFRYLQIPSPPPKSLS